MGDVCKVDEIARLLNDLALCIGVDRGADQTPDLLVVAKAWLAARNARDAALGADLFHNPAWDILLDLYVNQRAGERVAVSSACLGGSTPPTTALRWIGVLCDRGLVDRYPDEADRRRVYIQLSSVGIKQMEQALAGACESDQKLGLGRLRAFD